MVDPTPAPLTLDASARRIGHYCWLEMRLFEALGTWVQDAPEPEVKITLATHSRHHGWHAELWYDLLPALGDHASPHQPEGTAAPAGSSGVLSMPHTRACSWVAPPDEAFAAFVDAVVAPGEGATIERLVGVYWVLVPHVIAAYTHHVERTSPLADGPTRRVLRLVLSDESADGQDGEVLLRSLVSSTLDRDRAGARRARLARLLRESGGIAGPEPTA